MQSDLKFLHDKAAWVKRKTLEIHKIAPGIRIASSLSCIEILTALFYGGIVRHDPGNIHAEERDRFLISKAHGSVSFYPILADRGYFDMRELALVGKPGGMLGDIPDCSVPGYETVNGSLGHGLGVACGMALALKRKNRRERVYVLSGDGELYEGAVWEAVMFAAEHGLDNLVLIIDNNKICMLDYCRNIINLEPLEEKFRVFGWRTATVDGHDLKALCEVFADPGQRGSGRPLVVVANTVKGKGVTRLEQDSLCHIKAMSPAEIDTLLTEIP